MSVGGGIGRKVDREGKNVMFEECIYWIFSPSGTYDRSDGWWACFRWK